MQAREPETQNPQLHGPLLPKSSLTFRYFSHRPPLPRPPHLGHFLSPASTSLSSICHNPTRLSGLGSGVASSQTPLSITQAKALSLAPLHNSSCTTIRSKSTSSPPLRLIMQQTLKEVRGRRKGKQNRGGWRKKEGMLLESRSEKQS